MTQIQLTVTEPSGSPPGTVTRLHDALERAGFTVQMLKPGVVRSADEPAADWITFLEVDLDPAAEASPC